MIQKAIKLAFILCIPLSARAESGLVPDGVLRLGNGDYYSNNVVITDKENRSVSVWQLKDDKLVKVEDYSNDLGKAAGDKLVEGDNKTPEGVFFFNEVLKDGKVPFEKYGIKAITTNYPNLFDKRERKTGYGIWLHGIPDKVGLQRGSEGCVVISNDNILKITNYIKLNNTAFLIEDKVNYVKPSELKAKTTEMENFLKSWRNSWINKDLETYMNHYSESFYSSKKTKALWRAHKKHLNKSYKNIYVDFSDPVIFEVDNQIIVRTLQHYKSTYMDDFGEKTIYIEREAKGLKIVAETWKRVNRTKAKNYIASGSLLRETRLSSNQEMLSEKESQPN